MIAGTLKAAYRAVEWHYHDRIIRQSPDKAYLDALRKWLDQTLDLIGAAGRRS